MKHHTPHRRLRWPEGTHVLIASVITIALLVGVVVAVGKTAPPQDSATPKPARLLEK